MTHVVPDILARIAEHKRAKLAENLGRRGGLERQAAERGGHRDFRAALVAQPPAVIAEVKCASPSKGTLTPNFDPVATAKSYAAGGAAALSVLTDYEFFKGSLEDLENARVAVKIPVLRKDFTIDEFHVVEAAAHGADAFLLIAALLDEEEMRRFRELGTKYHMAALVEVHDREELNRALASGAEIVGVNNRNLHTFEVTLDVSLRLAEHIPANVIKVAESGIHSREDVQTLAGAGFQAFLVGEHLMKSADPTSALKALRS